MLANTRQVGFAPPEGVEAVLEQFPSNQRHLALPHLRVTQAVIFSAGLQIPLERGVW